MNQPTVTVLMPVFDGAAYLPAAIESVLRQTFSDLELLIVDDKSRDDSLEVIRSYADPRIRVLENERNLGQVPTVNRGLHEARGRYVARLDQDDIALPRRLALQVELLDREPAAAVVGGWVEVVDEQGRVLETLRGTIDDRAVLLFGILTHRLPIAHSAVTFRRDEVIDLGGYDESYRLAEDQHLWRQLALRHREIRIVPEVVVRYLVHAGQQSRLREEEQLANSLRSLDEFIASLAPSVPAAEVRRLLMLDVGMTPRDELAALTIELDRLIEASSRTLRFDARQRELLEHVLNRHLLAAVRSSWREGATAVRRRSPLVDYATRDLPAPMRAAHVAAIGAVMAGAPVLRAARRVRHGLRTAGR